MYDRCQQRHDDAQTAEPRVLHLQRLALLRELMRDLKDSNPEQRLRAGQMLLNISDISEDEESELHNASAVERDVAIREAGDAHDWVQQFRRGRQNEQPTSSHLDAVADRTISMLLGENAEESEVESDQPVKFQSPSERFQRYFNSELCEVPDPEEWAVPHYRENSPASGEET